MTLNDLKLRYGHYVVFSPKAVNFSANHVQLELDPHFLRQKDSSFWQCMIFGDIRGRSPQTNALKRGNPTVESVTPQYSALSAKLCEKRDRTLVVISH